MVLKFDYSPATEAGDLSNKVVLITGGTSGIGKEAVVQLSKLPQPPAHIYFTGRDTGRAEKVISEIAASPEKTPKVSFLACDLSSLTATKEAATKFKGVEERLDILILNAGIMNVAPGLTKDGYETQFGTNHLGHFQLFTQLEPLLSSTASKFNTSPRVTILTSEGYALHPKGGILFDTLRSATSGKSAIVGDMFGGWTRYGQSKLANMLMGQELARRYPGYKVAIQHPGVVGTELVSQGSIFTRALVYATNPRGLMTPEQGALNTIWGATSSKVVSGSFYVPVGIKTTPGSVESNPEKNKDLAKKLWDWSEGEVSTY